MGKNESTLEISIPISKQAIASLLTSAFEGGANYWYMIEEVNVPEPSDQVRYLDGDDAGGKFWNLYDGPLCKGGSLRISDEVGRGPGDKARVETLSLETIQRGLDALQAKYPAQMGNFLSGNYDANTGDVFLQCCLFGEVVYG